MVASFVQQNDFQFLNHCNLLILLGVWLERICQKFDWCMNVVTCWSYLEYDTRKDMPQIFLMYKQCDLLISLGIWWYGIGGLGMSELCDLLILLGVWYWIVYSRTVWSFDLNWYMILDWVFQNTVTYWSYLDMIWEKICHLLILLGIWNPDWLDLRRRSPSPSRTRRERSSWPVP